MSAFIVTQVDMNGERVRSIFPSTGVAEVVVDDSAKSITFTLNNGGVVEVVMNDEFTVDFVSDQPVLSWSMRTTDADIGAKLARTL